MNLRVRPHIWSTQATPRRDSNSYRKQHDNFFIHDFAAKNLDGEGCIEVVMFFMPHHSLATELFVNLEQFLSLNILLSQMVTFA